MIDKDDLFDTTSDFSVQDVLDEIKSGFSDSDEEDINIEDILAEFSEPQKKSEKPVIKKSAEVVKPEERKDEKKPVRKEQGEKLSEKEESFLKERGDAVRMIDTVIRPWENGMYGDMSLDDTPAESEKKKEKEKKRRRHNQTISETFDTFTRSELFEEKIQEEPLETRSVEDIIFENRRISRLLTIRSIFLFILSILSCYLAFANPLKWFIPTFISYIHHPFRYLFLTALFQICAMLLSVDVISKGVSGICRFRPNAESIITFSSFASLIHVISVMAAPHWKGWLPYSAISVLGLFFTIYSKLINIRAVCRVCKTVKSAKCPSTVHIVNRYDQTNIIKQTNEDTKSFIAHINDKDAARTFWSFISPILIVTSIVFAALASFGTRTPEHFFWALAAISSVAPPFFMSLSFAHPFSLATKGLNSIGAAISGWYSAKHLSKNANFIVCDEDIFPKGTITLHGLRILGKYSLEKTVCYTASIITESKSGLSDVFADLLKSRYGEAIEVRNLQYHESGGLEAINGGDNVLIGGAGFIMRCGVKLESGNATKNAIFVAINKEPAGVFNVNYKANLEVERALHLMIKKKIPVVLAVRDFNLLPMMVENTFDLPENTLEYPEIEERVDLSSEEQFINEDACAVITRSGLYPFASAVLLSKKLRSATIRNICLSAIGSFIGIFLMFYLTFMQRPILVTPHTVFVYMMMWMIPTWMLSGWVKK